MRKYKDNRDFVNDSSAICALYGPANIGEINRRLAQPRPSLSPSHFIQTEFLEFKRKDREALTESMVMSKTFPVIAGSPCIPFQENLRFNNLEDLTDGSTTKAQPDVYDGLVQKTLISEFEKSSNFILYHRRIQRHHACLIFSQKGRALRRSLLYADIRPCMTVL